MKDEAYLIYSDSIESLIKSDCIDYMVYRVLNGDKSRLSDIENFPIEVNISEEWYDKLHSNLCQKLRPVFKNKPKRNEE